MKLIYRAQTFDYMPRLGLQYQKPYALNWRYQVPGETYGDTPISIRPYEAPRALNWRYRLTAD
jgi:hypothetical protein